MSMFTCYLLFDHFQFAFIHGPNIPGSYAILVFTASDLASITCHIHWCDNNWVLFLLWLHLFIFSGVNCPLISSNILCTYQPREFIFQCPIFLPFHTVHGVVIARILKWFAIPFSSGPHFIRTLHQKSLRRNGVAMIVNKRVQNAELGCNLRNDIMNSACFQGKPFNIRVI